MKNLVKKGVPHNIAIQILAGLCAKVTIYKHYLHHSVTWPNAVKKIPFPSDKHSFPDIINMKSIKKKL